MRDRHFSSTQGALDAHDTVGLGIKVAEALDGAHRIGVLHGDVKPANILFGKYGEPLLSDFGTADIAGGVRADSAVAEATAFSAPEVLTGAAPTVLSDLYGLGATLLYALTGRVALERHVGESVGAQSVPVFKGTPRRAPEIEIPRPLAEALGRVMADDPSARPPSAAAFSAELRAIEDSMRPDSGTVTRSDAATTSSPAGPANRASALRVVVADDHPIYRDGLARHLDEFDTIDVLAAASDGQQAINQISTLVPDVAVVDLRLPTADGIEVLEELERRGCRTRVILLSAYVDSATVYRAIAAGAGGYLEKSASIDDIRKAIETVARGDTAIGPAVNAALATEIRARAHDTRSAVLTERETEILTLAADGLSTQQIARQLGVRQPTVKTHLTRAYEKLGVPDRAAAVAKAFRLGLLS